MGLSGEGWLLITEGPTDCAAAMDLGFDAIGRASCLTGVRDVKVLLSRYPRKFVLIVADNDTPKMRSNGETFYPGREGANILAKTIRPLAGIVRVAMPPEHKDLWDWLKDGATHDDIINLAARATGGAFGE
jgi:hypothetical protein